MCVCVGYATLPVFELLCGGSMQRLLTMNTMCISWLADAVAREQARREWRLTGARTEAEALGYYERLSTATLVGHRARRLER